MKLPEFLNQYSGMRKERSYSRVIIGVLALACLILAQMASSKKPVVVLVPQNLQGEGTVSENTASANIKKAWGLTVGNLVGNVTPGNVDFVERALEGMLSPQLYHSMLLDIHEQAEAIRGGEISLSFVPAGVYFQASKNIVFVTGETTRTSRFGEPERGRRTFEFVIEVSDYRPSIVEWDAYSGGPRINYNREAEDDKATKTVSLTDLEAVAENSETVAEQQKESPSVEPQSEVSTAQPSEVLPQEKGDTQGRVDDVVENKLKEIL
jgi:conjugal transfer pilus assembly protein TraE